MSDSALLQRCLRHGLKITQMMTIGLYNEPHGAYLLSIHY